MRWLLSVRAETHYAMCKVAGALENFPLVQRSPRPWIADVTGTALGAYWADV